MKKDADDAETAIISSSEKVILDFLERDIAAHPERLQPITAGAGATRSIAGWRRLGRARHSTAARRRVTQIHRRIAWLVPDGHFKFPHLWPVKFPQAGRLNYQLFGLLGSDVLSG